MTLWTDAGNAATSLLFNLTVFGATVALCTVALIGLTRRSGSRSRYVIALAGFFSAVAIPVLMTVVAARSPLPVIELPSSHASTLPAGALSNDSANLTSWITGERRRVAPWGSSVPLGRTVPGLWLCGTLILILRELIAHRRLRRQRHRWEPIADDARERLNWPASVPGFLGPEPGPFVIGVGQPSVVLPRRLLTELPIDEARAIVRHELSHVVWRDPLVNAVVRFICTFVWPSVPLWYLAGRVRTEREAAADAAALDDPRNQLDVADYAAALVAVARWSQCGNVAASGPSIPFGQDAGLEQRIRRLVVPRSLPSTRIALAGLSLVVGIGGLATLPVSWEARLQALESMPHQARIAAIASTDTRTERRPHRVVRATRVAHVQRRDEPSENRNDISLVVKNEENAPVVITAAIGKLARRSEFAWDPRPDESGITLPQVTVRNESAQPVAGFVIGFGLSHGRPGAFTGLVRRTLRPGESATYETQWAGPNFFLPGRPSEINAFLSGVLFSNGETWIGAASNTETIRQLVR